MTPLGDDRYRIESEPFSCMMAERARDIRRLPSYGDVIEARVVEPDVLRFVRVVTRARWEQVMRLFGGLVVIYLPPGSGFDPLKELNRET